MQLNMKIIYQESYKQNKITEYTVSAFFSNVRVNSPL